MFESAVHIFRMVRDNLEQCAAMSAGQPLMLLQSNAKLVLRKYADTVARRVPNKRAKV